MTAAALKTERLAKRYGSAWVLRDCDLALPAGGVIALVGPNGAGKTTLLQLAAGLRQPTSGSVSVFGESCGSRRALTQVGFVSQDHALYRRFRVAELLRMGAALNDTWDLRLAEKRLSDLGIPLARKAGRLSGGQQAQVALALALAKRPRLLILDEPVASLDPLARRDFMQTLMAIVADEQLTVLLSSHNIAELERVCDHLVVVAQGQVQLDGDIDDLIAAHRVLTGPWTGPLVGPEVIHVVRGPRHAQVVARVGGGEPMPGWQAQPIGLEDLVLAYLQRAYGNAVPTVQDLEVSA